jgi:hypothetical protein
MLKFDNFMIGSDSSQKNVKFGEDKLQENVTLPASLSMVEMLLGMTIN